MTLDPEVRLAHYGYRVERIERPWGTRWTFSPKNDAYDWATKEEALSRANFALDCKIRETQRMEELIRTAPRANLKQV